MPIREKLKTIRNSLKTELAVYKAVYKDPRTPLLAKICFGLAIGYLLLPFDLIPDFIPVIGHIDDLIIVPFFIYLGIKLIPLSVMTEYRQKFISKNN